MVFRMDVMMLSVLGEFDDDQIENKEGFQNKFRSFSFPVRLTMLALNMHFDLENIFSIVL